MFLSNTIIMYGTINYKTIQMKQDFRIYCLMRQSMSKQHQSW